MDVVLVKDWLDNGEITKKAYKRMKNIVSFKEIQKEYEKKYVPYLTFEEYLMSNFIPMYDKGLNFIGYERQNMRELLNELTQIASKNIG